MAVVGTLTVSLVARTDKFARGMNRASQKLDRFSAKAGRYAMQVGAMATAILGSLAAATAAFANYGDTVAKMARRTGLSVKTVSELGYMAEITGGSIEGLEKGVRRMAKAISDAQDGMATYVRAFGKIGLRAEDLAKMTPEDAFLAIGDAIAKTEDPMVRAAAAYDLLGRTGTQMLPLFDLGAEGMDLLRKRAEQLGIVLSGKTSKDAELLTDALVDIKKGAIGLSIAIAEGLGIPFDDLSERIADFVERTRKWIKETEKLIPLVLDLGLGLGVLAATLGAVAVAAKVVAVVLGVISLIPIVAMWISIVAATGALVAGTLKLIEVLTPIPDVASDAAAGIDKLTEAEKAAADEAERMRSIHEEVNALLSAAAVPQIPEPTTAKLFDPAAGLSTMAAVRAPQERLDALIARQQTWTAMIEKTLAVQETLRKELARASSAEQQERITKALVEAGREGDGLVKSRRQDQEEIKKLVALQIELGQRAKDSFADFSFDIDDVMGGFETSFSIMQRPAALERGTVGAYSAGVATPHYRGVESVLAESLKEERAAGKTLQSIDQHMGDLLSAQPAVVGI